VFLPHLKRMTETSERRKTAKTVEQQQLVLPIAGTDVPAILMRPVVDHPVPAALLLHGYSSNKEQLSSTMGRSLAVRGIASLSIDLPLHGDRDDALVADARSNPLGLLQHWRMALAEAGGAIDFLEQDARFSSGQIAAVGYSLGGYIALITATQEPRVRAVIIAAGGDLPVGAWSTMLRTVADPTAAVQLLGGRPLLMLNGRADRIIPAAQAERLFNAASNPKELRWYDSGHVLPPAAADDAAEWLRTAFAFPAFPL
jgi:dienelactone hydrolase